MGTIRIAAAAACLLLAGFPAASPATAQAPAGQGAAAPATADNRSLLDILDRPGIDLFFSVRSHAAGATRPGAGTNFQKAVAEAARLEQELGGSARWGLIEGALVGCSTAADIRRSFEGFPESYDFGGRVLPLRESTVRFARALEAAEPEFLAGEWPARRKTIAAGRADIQKVLAPGERVWVANLVHYLGFQRPARPVTIYLVADAPAPHAFTRLDRGSRPVIFIGIGQYKGSTLAEMVVHEMIHALDAEQGRTQGAFFELRGRLRAAGIDPGSQEGVEISHALMYLQSGETMRRIVDSRHLHFGETYGTYGRMPTVVPSLREWWFRYLDGAIERGEALDGFLAEYRAARG